MGTLGPEGAAVGTPGACCPVHLKPSSTRPLSPPRTLVGPGSLAGFRSYAAMPPRKRKFPALSLVFAGFVVHGTQTVSVQNIQAANPGAKSSHL